MHGTGRGCDKQHDYSRAVYCELYGAHTHTHMLTTTIVAGTLGQAPALVSARRYVRNPHCPKIEYTDPCARCTRMHQTVGGPGPRNFVDRFRSRGASAGGRFPEVHTFGTLVSDRTVHATCVRVCHRSTDRTDAHVLTQPASWFPAAARGETALRATFAVHRVAF